MGKDTHRIRRTSRRTLRAESLEPRVVLAADVAAAIGIESLAAQSMSVQVNLSPASISQAVTGDINSDGFVNAGDIDVLAAAIREGNQAPEFDLNKSSGVDRGDMDMLIHDLLNTEYGDANLDRVVSEADRAIWQANQFQSNLGWANGNFNGDEVVDVSDFNVWNGNRISIVRTVILTGADDSSIDQGTLDSSMDPVESQTTEPAAQAVMLGDFNGDGLVDAVDIDLLSSAIRSGEFDSQYDLNANGQVDKGDLNMIVHDILETTFGDANLDGFVDTADLHRVSTNLFQLESGWEQGDFNGDGVTDVSDLNLWNSHRFIQPSTVVTLTGTSPTADEQSTVNEQVDEAEEFVPAAAAVVMNGDFNDDDQVNAQDIDMLTEAIRDGNKSTVFDLNNDADVNRADLDMMVLDILGVQYGDANLDGFVNGIDESTWGASRFAFETGWATGDFNGDGLTDVSDFNIYNSNRTAEAPTVILTGTQTANEATDQPTSEAASSTELASLEAADKSDLPKEAKFNDIAAKYRSLKFL